MAAVSALSQYRQNLGQNNNWRRNRLFSRERNYNSRGFGRGRGYFRRGGF